MLAEAIRLLADRGNQVLLIQGMKEARRKAPPEHPLGAGRTICYWSFIVA